MEISIFLAQVFGIYFLVIGLSLFIRKRAVYKLMSELVRNSHIMYPTGMFIFILGLLLVLSHNIWTSGWVLLITILSWLTLLKGVAYLFIPGNHLAKFGRAVWKIPGFYVIIGILSIVIGVYFIIQGFGLV